MKTGYYFLLFSVIFITSCSSSTMSTKLPVVFEPQKTNEVYYFYSNGIPLSSYNVDSLTVLSSLDLINILDNQYIRIWFLFKNNSSSPIDLDPSKVISLGGKIKVASELEFIQPDSPTRINALIDAQAQSDAIAKTIGGTLQLLSVQTTTFTNSKGEKTMINDLNEKKSLLRRDIQNEINNTSNFYETYKSGINQGILRRNTIFPNTSVNGYVYFLTNRFLQNKKYDINFLEYFKVRILNVTKEKIVEYRPTMSW